MNYQEKLRIFHDHFVKYAWNYIGRQKGLEAGQTVSAVTTAFIDQVSPLTKIPVVGSLADLVIWTHSLWNDPILSTSMSINSMFTCEDKVTIKVLSAAIQEIAVHTEHHLIQLESAQEIGAFAKCAITKLIYFLKTNSAENLNERHIVEAVLKQEGWLWNDNFISQGPRQSDNYHFRAENEESIATEIDGNRREISFVSKQRISYQKLEGSSPTKYIYKPINPPLFQTDIESLRIDKIAEQISKQEPAKQKVFDNVRGGIANFVGREKQLADIEEFFLNYQGGVQIIGGLVGSGKTQAALRYINKHKENYNYRVRWIKADSESSLEISFREFAHDLYIDETNIDTERLIKAVLAKLERELDKSLIVFDNALDRSSLNKYLPSPKALKKHDIIISTTNTKDWQDSASAKEYNIIKLPVFSDQEAKDYIKNTLGDASPADIKKLSELFSYIPLGLSQSLAFIVANEMQISDYLSELDKTKIYRQNSQNSEPYSQDSQLPEHMLDLSLEDDKEYAHIPNIYITLLMTLERVKNLSPGAFQLIKLCSYLSTEFIPLSLFENIFSLQSEKGRAISTLKGYSLLSVRDKNNRQYADTHRIIQKVIMKHTDIEERAADIVKLAKNILEHKLFTRDNTSKQKYDNNKNNLLHVESIIIKADKYNVEITSELLYLRLSRAVYYDFNGDHERAKRYLLSIKKSLETKVGITEDLPIESVVLMLVERDKKLPTLYAQICYHLGKSNLSLRQKELEDADNLNSPTEILNRSALFEFEKAVSIRAIIDASRELYDDSFNEGVARPMDSTIFKRQGLLFWYKIQKTRDAFSKVLEGYNELIKHEEDLPAPSRDNFNLDTCRRLYIETLNEILDITNSENIESILNLLEKIAVYLGINSSASARDILAEKMFAALQEKDLEYTRIARDYNLIGKIFTKIYANTNSIQDIGLARKFISEAKQIEESNNRQNFLLDEANKILADISKLEASIKEEKRTKIMQDTNSLIERSEIDDLKIDDSQNLLIKQELNDENSIIGFDLNNRKLMIRGDGNCLFNAILLAIRLEHPDIPNLTDYNSNDLRKIVKNSLLKDKASENKFLLALKSEIEEDIMQTTEYNDRLTYYSANFQNILRYLNSTYLRASTKEEKATVIYKISKSLAKHDIYQEYIDKIFNSRAFGGNVEIAILSKRFGINIKIIQPDNNSISIENETNKLITLFYNGVDHYDVILSHDAVDRNIVMLRYLVNKAIVETFSDLNNVLNPQAKSTKRPRDEINNKLKPKALLRDESGDVELQSKRQKTTQKELDMLNENTLSEFDDYTARESNTELLMNQIRQNVNPPIGLLETEKARQQRYTLLAKAFRDLGELYIAKSEESNTHSKEQIKYYLEASKLFNYDRSIGNESHIADVRIEHINAKLLEIFATAHVFSASENAARDKAELTALRELSKAKLEQIDGLAEADKIASSRVLFEIIAQGMQNFLARLYRESEAALGAPPCSYSVIGLGSMALKTITPYSDLEFAIITEKLDPAIKDYFIMLTQLVHFRIINLGETVIASSNLQGIYTDHLIKKGVSLDLGGKTPLGREDKFYDLIQTTEGMLYYLKNQDNKVEHLDKNLPYILEATCFIYGSQALHADYTLASNQFLLNEINEEGVFNHQARAIKRLKEGTAEYDYSNNALTVTKVSRLVGDLEKFAPSCVGNGIEGRSLDVKQHIYRLADRLIYDLALFYGIIPDSPWDALNQLYKNNIFNEINLLLAALSFATSFRLKIYLYYKGQNEEALLFQKIERIINYQDATYQPYVIEDKEQRVGGDLFSFFCTALAFCEKVLDFENKYNNLSQEAKDFFRDLRLNLNDQYYHGLTLTKFAKFQDAIACLEQVLQANRNFTHDKIFAIIDLLIRNNVRIGNIDQALDLSLQLLSKQREYYQAENIHIADTLHYIGVAFGLKSDYENSIKALEDSLEIKHKVLHAENFYKVCDSLDGLGAFYAKLSRWREAEEKLLESLSLREKYYDKNDQALVSTLNILTEVYREQAKYDSAIIYANRASKILQENYKDTPHIDTAQNFLLLSDLTYSTQNFSNSLICGNIAKEMYARINRGEVTFDTVNAMERMAIAYMGLEKFSEALEIFERIIEITLLLEKGVITLNILRAHAHLATVHSMLGNSALAKDHGLKFLEFSDQVTTPTDDNLKAECYNALGKACLDLGESEDALKYFEQFFDFVTKFYQGINHPNIALAYNQVGVLHLQIHQLDTAESYLNKAIEIMQKLEGKEVVIHYNTELAYHNLFLLYAEKEDLKQAISAIEKCIRIKLTLQSEKPSIDIALLYHALARMSADDGSYEKAFICYFFTLKNIESFKETVKFNEINASFNQFISSIAQYIDPQASKNMMIYLFQNGLHNEDPGIHYFFAKFYFNTGDLLNYTHKLEKVLSFVAENDIGNKASILNNLATVYHLVGYKSKMNHNAESESYYKKAEESFMTALELTKENIKTNLHVEYSNFLLETGKYGEAISHLLQTLDKGQDRSFLAYGLIEIDTIANVLQNKIRQYNKEITVVPVEYAYYLLLHHYNIFSEFVVLKTKQEYLDEFRQIVSSSIGHYLYAETQIENEISNDNFLFTEQGLEFLRLAELFLNKAAFNALINFCNSKEVSAQELAEQDYQQINRLLNLMLDRETDRDRVEQVIEITPTKIDQISSFIGKSDLENNSGFYQFVFNALGNNIFSNSAKQVIKAINHQIESLEDLMIRSLHNHQEDFEMGDRGTSIWTQLEYLLEFTVSGQRFTGFGRPPSSDPDDGFGDGGSGGSGEFRSDPPIDHSHSISIFLPSNSTLGEINHIE